MAFYQFHHRKVQGDSPSSKSDSNIEFPQKGTPLYCNIIMSHILIFFVIIMAVILSILEWYSTSQFVVFCKYLSSFAVLCYHYSKFSVYYIFVLRVQIAFYDSQFQYSRKIIIGFYIWITFLFLVAIGGDFLQIRGDWTYYEKEDIYWCQIYVEIWGVIFTTFVDIITAISLMIMFVRPLIILLKTSSNATDNILRKTVTKYTLLTSFAVLFTLLTMIFIAVGFGSFGTIDCIVNSVCIMLMSQIHSNVYKIVCKPCYGCIEKFSIGSEDVNNLDMIVNGQTKSVESTDNSL